ncbi:MAG: TonB-dependent receptor [Candidatus Marinimicrobia bacterium]|nr:TonB-dependent receptor [Candidatus Neomarinimicrobiota bacterium]
MKKYSLMIIILATFMFLKAEPPFEKALLMGTVKDSESNAPLVGVNVMVTNTTIGTATNLQGEFILPKVPAGPISLSISMMGYRTEKIDLRARPHHKNTVDILLTKTLLEMGSVVITGTGTPHLIEDAPVKTRLISRLNIEQRKAANAAEALDFQPGINVENDCQNCNFSQVRILGMDGKYSQVLIDGDPVISSLAGVYGLEHFPAEMLDRIEVIKGGGSSLYGGGAVAGVINMVTRRPVVEQARIKYNYGVTEKNNSDVHIGASSEIVGNSGKTGAYIFASLRNRDKYDRNGDSYSELGLLKNESMGFNWYYSPIREGEISTHFHRIHESRRGGNKFNRPYHEADIAEALEHWKWGGTVKWKHQVNALLDYNTFYSFATTDRKSYYGGLGGGTSRADSLAALKAYGTTENPLQIAGMTANYKVGCHLITTGLQYSIDKVNDKSTSNAVYYIDETYTNIGYFLQDNMHFGEKEKMELVVGTRIDHHSELEKVIISPRLNLKYDINQVHTFRAGLSTGFKAPQTYDEDLHICGLEGDQKVIRNSSDLEEEKSYSYTAGLDYNGYIGRIGVLAGVTAYYTTVDGVFQEEFRRSENQIDVWERVNGSSANVKGIELELGIQPKSSIQLLGGFTYADGKYEEELADWGTKNFLRTPKISGTLGVNAKIFNNLGIFLQSKYMGRADVPHEILVEGQDEPLLLLEESQNFFQSDIILTCNLAFLKDINSKFSLGVKNIFNAYQENLDKGPERDPAFVYGPANPRIINFGLEVNF